MTTDSFILVPNPIRSRLLSLSYLSLEWVEIREEESERNHIDLEDLKETGTPQRGMLGAPTRPVSVRVPTLIL